MKYIFALVLMSGMFSQTQDVWHVQYDKKIVITSLNEDCDYIKRVRVVIVNKEEAKRLFDIKKSHVELQEDGQFCVWYVKDE
jgi:hypothetical protein